MCAQIDILKKIRKKGKVNGYDVDLAEAQAKDFVAMKNRVEKERLDGQKWNLITSVAKHKAVWIILALVAISFTLAGDRLVTIIEKLI